jgi:polyisoprenoid-binding protein YceI
MKNLNKRSTVIYMIMTVILCLAVPQLTRAQSLYKAVAGKESYIKVLGSSNVHDWNMSSSSIESQGEFKSEGDQLKSLTSLQFSVDAKSLKSEHESMDGRTYKTIKADQFPKISFKLSSATISGIQKNKFLIKAKGELTIAGASQSIIMDVTATINPDNTITCTGTQKLQLRDYKIDPPSFMLGAMKVANDLTIQFNIVYKKN